MSAATELLADGSVSVNGAAEFTGVSVGELYKAMARGELEFFYHGTSRLIARRELVRWLAEKHAATARRGRVT